MFSSKSLAKQTDPRELFNDAFTAADKLTDKTTSTNNEIIAAFEKARQCFLSHNR